MICYLENCDTCASFVQKQWKIKMIVFLLQAIIGYTYIGLRF